MTAPCSARYPTAYAVADLAITGARLAGTVALAGVGLACVALYLSGSIAAAKRRLAAVYSWAPYSTVSSGQAAMA